MPNSPYTSQTISGYNSSPPANDGSAVAANQLDWTVNHIGKIGDPLKDLAEAINTQLVAAFAKVINTDANENNSMAGSLAFTESTLTIASGAVTATRTSHIVAAESGTTDTLDTIATGSVSDGAILVLRPDSGDTITVTDAATGAGEIHMTANANFVMSGDESLVLQRRGTDWYEIGVNDIADLGTYTGVGQPDFTSAEQTVALDIQLDVAHGLGQIPNLSQIILRCKTADLNYSANDEVILWPIGAGADTGVTAFMNGTNVSIVQGVSIDIHNRTTFNTANITVGNWRWIVHAWKGGS